MPVTASIPAVLRTSVVIRLLNIKHFIMIQTEPIKLNDLLRLSEEDLWDYKLHLAAWNGEEHPLDVFMRDFEEWQSWNEYKGDKDVFNREYIFSLIPDYHRPGKYIFGGVFRVVERLPDWNKVELASQYRDLIGRLVVDFYRYQGLRGRSFIFSNYIDQMTVSELLEKPYGGIDFPGYENVLLPFDMLEVLVTNQKQDWITALGNVKGIYVICDKSNGKKYVGSASGGAGIWSRWSCYASTGHGYNDDLVAVIDKQGMDYARANFQFSVLEVISMRADDDYVINRESFWKDVLLTRTQFGYNKN